MNFGEQIKRIRREQTLTQEQMAEKLHVTRQAISNWENDRNLPDIEMLICMSQTFRISLDQLILGETDMNNMTEKLIRDGSETRRARLNLIGVCIGAALLLIGSVLLVIKGLSVEYVDAEGILHENFFLLPIGFLFLFCGFIAFLITGIRSAILLCREQEGKASARVYVGICLGVVLLCFGGFLVLYASNSGANTAVPGAVCVFAGIACLIGTVFQAMLREKKTV